ERNHGERLAAHHHSQQRAHPGRRQAGKNGQWMNVAFVEDAQHDVDHHNGREDEKGFTPQRRAKLGGAAGERRRHRVGQTDFFGGTEDGIDRGAQRSAGREVEGKRHRRELTLVRDGEGGGAEVNRGKGVQGNHLPRGGFHVNLFQGGGRLLKLRIHL